MEQNIFEVLQGLEGEVKVGKASTYLTHDFSGSINIKRGNFSMDINFSARVGETKHKGIVIIDDWDVHDSDNYNLNGLPIDSLSSFRAKLTEWGFGNVGKKLEFTNEEQKRAIAMAMVESEELKKIYGKKFNVMTLLSVDEQMLLELNYLIVRFNDCGAHIKNVVNKHYGLGEETTLEQYKEKLAELTK
jgi:hypothetical protein